MFESSFWTSGYPIGLVILLAGFIISKMWRGNRW